MNPKVHTAYRWYGIFFVLFFAGLLYISSFDQWLDTKLLTLQFNILREIAPQPLEKDVLVVGIDETSFQTFIEPMALWHKQLGTFFSAMAAAKAQVVGVDLALPERSYETVFPGYDKALLSGLLKLRKSGVPLVLARTHQADGKPRKIHYPIVSLAGGEEHIGSALVFEQESSRPTLFNGPKDPYKAVRYFHQEVVQLDPVTGKEYHLPTLSQQIARQLGVETKPGLVNYAVGERFNYVPFHQVVQWASAEQGSETYQTLHNKFKDKVVLLGLILRINDAHYLPVNLFSWEEDTTTPGVFLQAQMLRNILNNGMIQTLPEKWLALFLFLSFGFWFLGYYPLYAILATSLWTIGAIIAATQALYLGWYFPISAGVLIALFAVIFHVSLKLFWENMVAKQLVIQSQFVRDTFGRYLSDKIVNRILDHPEGLTLGGENREITLLMSDLRGFSNIGDELAAEDMIKLINIYLEEMSEVILAYDGVIDEFIGDAIMVIFGIPLAEEDDAERAISCAIAMQLAMEKVNFKSLQAGYPELEMGIAVNTGIMVVGNIGSEKRSKYGAVGSEVNMTARIESYTLGGQIIISQNTLERSRVPLDIINSNEIFPKGSKEPLTIYQIKGIKNHPSLSLPDKEGEAFETLSQAIKIDIFPLKNKMAGNTAYPGLITQLSSKQAILEVQLPKDVSSSLKISLFDEKQEIISTELFAKIIQDKLSSGEKRAKIVTVHFTYIPEDAKQFFKQLIGGQVNCKQDSA